MEIKCSGDRREIFSKIRPKLEQYKRDGKLQITDVQFDEAQQICTAKGTGFKAKLACADGKVTIELELGLLLKPLRSKIESELAAVIQRVVG